MSSGRGCRVVARDSCGAAGREGQVSGGLALHPYASAVVAPETERVCFLQAEKQFRENYYCSFIRGKQMFSGL